MESKDCEAVWIMPADLESGEKIISVFHEAGFANALRMFETPGAFGAVIADGKSVPALMLLDLDLPPSEIQRIFDSVHNSKSCQSVPVLALVSAQSEGQLDSAYDSGARTYLRKPFTFAQFLERGRLLNLHFVIGRSPPPG